MANRNRTAGHDWERESAKKLEHIGFKDVVTSRFESKSLDNAKVDLTRKFGNRLPINIQCKSSSKAFSLGEVLEEMPKDKKINVVFLEQTKKAKKYFVKHKEYAVLSLDDFLKLIKDANYVIL